MHPTEPPHDNKAFVRLMSWFSPSFPVGAYTYSHGIEFAVECGMVRDRQTLGAWLQTILLQGAGFTDAVFFARAHEAAVKKDRRLLERIFEKAAAMKATAEMALESSAQGRAFLKTLKTVWPHSELEFWEKHLAGLDIQPSYPVAAALATALHGIALKAALTAFIHSNIANLISAGVRLIPLGQTEGQMLTAEMESVIGKTLDKAISTDLERVGGSALLADWTSMQHETQYTRLFRS